MNQSRLSSLYEAVLNIVIGFSINFFANFLILPTINCHVTVAQNLWLGTLFTAVSLARQYAIRRWFNGRVHALAESWTK